MKKIFSDYIRSLGSDGEPPDGSLDRLWTELRRLLRRGLQRRGLWDRPPAYVGVPGHTSWTLPETGDRRGVPSRDYDALDELTSDFYSRMFLERLGKLCEYVRLGNEIETVVQRGVQQFFHDRQKEQDPLGFRLFQRLRSAIRQSIEGDRLFVVAGDPRITNDTVLTFDPETDSEPADDDQITLEVRSWDDELLLDLVLARGAEVQVAIDRLESCVLGLRDAGIEVFGFKTLVDALKNTIRQRLADLWEEGSASANAVRDPLTRRIEVDRLRDLSRCVERGIRTLPLQARVREKLLRLWRFLEAFALEELGPIAADSTDEALKAAIRRNSLPPNRSLSRLLGIRHDRFPDLFARLRSEVERCLSTLREGAAPVKLSPLAGPRRPEMSVDESRNLRQELKRKTAEAFQRQSLAARNAKRPRAGDLYSLAACPEPGVEWLLLEVEGSRCLVAPADTVPWIGSADVVLDGDTAPLSVRCAHGVWIEHRHLSGVPSVSAGSVEEARTHRRQWLAGQVAATAQEHEVDVDPDYLEWVETLDAARDAVAREYGISAEPGRDAESGSARPTNVLEYRERKRERKTERPRPRPPIARYMLVAASITGLVAGSFWVGRSLAIRTSQQPEAAVPWFLAPSGTQRGTAKLQVHSGARWLGMLIEADAGDRIEIRERGGDLVWEATIEKSDTAREALLVWPASLTPSGEYDVLVWSHQQLLFDFLMNVQAE